MKDTIRSLAEQTIAELPPGSRPRVILKKVLWAWGDTEDRYQKARADLADALMTLVEESEHVRERDELLSVLLPAAYEGYLDLPEDQRDRIRTAIERAEPVVEAHEQRKRAAAELQAAFDAEEAADAEAEAEIDRDNHEGESA